MLRAGRLKLIGYNNIYMSTLNVCFQERHVVKLKGKYVIFVVESFDFIRLPFD